MFDFPPAMGLPERAKIKYLNTVSQQRHRAKTFELTIECLSKFDFDTIVVTGVSGLLIGPVVAHMMGKKIAVIRKEDDGSHSSDTIEGEIGDRYVIIDDFICTGTTVKRMKARMKSTCPRAVCVGLYSYYPETYSSKQTCIDKHKRCELECLNEPFGWVDPPLPPQEDRVHRAEYKAVIDCKILPTDPPPPVVTEITFALKDAERPERPEITKTRDVLLRMQREMDSLVNAEIKIAKLSGIDTGLDKFKKWYSPASEPYKTTVTDLDKPPDKPPKEFGFGPEFFVSKMPRVYLKDLIKT